MSVSTAKTTLDADIKQWDTALSRKDAKTLASFCSDDYRIFDVMENVKGAKAYQALWEKCFPYFEDTIGIERKDVQMHVTDDMAFMHFYSRLSGMKGVPEEAAKTWIRVTACFIRENGAWKVAHEHVSFPVNCETNEIKFLKDEDIAA